MAAGHAAAGPAATSPAPPAQKSPPDAEKTEDAGRNGRSVYELCLHTFDGLGTIRVDENGLTDVNGDLAQMLVAMRERAVFAGDFEQPPAGLEPATCGLQNRCSAN